MQDKDREGERLSEEGTKRPERRCDFACREKRRLSASLEAAEWLVATSTPGPLWRLKASSRYTGAFLLSPENTRCLETMKCVTMGPFDRLFPAGNESFSRDCVLGKD